MFVSQPSVCVRVNNKHFLRVNSVCAGEKQKIVVVFPSLFEVKVSAGLPLVLKNAFDAQSTFRHRPSHAGGCST